MSKQPPRYYACFRKAIPLVRPLLIFLFLLSGGGFGELLADSQTVQPFFTVKAVRKNMSDMSISLFPLQSDQKINNIPFNKVFAARVMVAQSGESSMQKKGPVKLLKVDARMPAHNHGMMVKPVISRLGPHEFQVDGLKLHMRGDWVFYFELEVEGKKMTFEKNYKL